MPPIASLFDSMVRAARLGDMVFKDPMHDPDMVFFEPCFPDPEPSYCVADLPTPLRVVWRNDAPPDGFRVLSLADYDVKKSMSFEFSNIRIRGFRGRFCIRFGITNESIPPEQAVYVAYFQGIDFYEEDLPDNRFHDARLQTRVLNALQRMLAEPRRCYMHHEMAHMHYMSRIEGPEERVLWHRRAGRRMR